MFLISVHVALLSITTQIAFRCVTAWALVPMVVEGVNLVGKEAAKLQLKLKDLVPPAASDKGKSSGERLLRKAMATEKKSDTEKKNAAGGNAVQQEPPAAPVRSEEKAAAVASELAELTAFLGGRGPAVKQLRRVGESAAGGKPTPSPVTWASAATPSDVGGRCDAPVSQGGSSLSAGSDATVEQTAPGLGVSGKTTPLPAPLLGKDAVGSEALGVREGAVAGAAASAGSGQEPAARRIPVMPTGGVVVSS
ncbi:hypothetical protein T484DRAFT_1797045 [Baffinella frigidus]|nr:hypothetical protein T484DRAFT_1797045 [Cryptophyta sp. CCMP2293]